MAQQNDRQYISMTKEHCEKRQELSVCTFTEIE